MFTHMRHDTGKIRSSRDSSLVASGPPALGRLLFLGRVTCFSTVARCARLPGVTSPSRRSHIGAALCAALAMLLIVAPAALADNGVGLAGPTTDKTVTFFCFGVIAFFAILVIVLSLIQGRLEKRKEMRRSDLQRYS